MSELMDVARAESKAKKSSFYAGMKVLPKAERSAMFAIYAFCRAVDDIADEQGADPKQRHADLDAWRADLDALYSGGPGGRAGFLADSVAHFALRKADFLAIIDGMRMDVEQDICAPDFAVLDLYCDRVASAVGRLSVRTFGMDDAPGEALAYHLGRALQLTNILRDLDEDAEIGRLYLAREWLEAAGINASTPEAIIASPAIDRAARRCADEARRHYAAADEIMGRKPKGRLLAPRLMSAVYGEILNRMEQQGWAAPRPRISLPSTTKLLILLRCGLHGL